MGGEKKKKIEPSHMFHGRREEEKDHATHLVHIMGGERRNVIMASPSVRGEKDGEEGRAEEKARRRKGITPHPVYTSLG